MTTSLFYVILVCNNSYFTFTIKVTFFFPEVTVIVAFPAFLPITLPFEVTIATLFLLDLKLNLLADVIGETTGLSWIDLPFLIKTTRLFAINLFVALFLSVNFFVVTAPLTTLTVILAFFPFFVVTVIVALPTFFALILPFLSTVTILFLELFQLLTASPLPSVRSLASAEDVLPF